MKPLALARPARYEDAASLLRDARFSLPVLKAGGMDVLDHLKEGLIEPDLLIDVRTLRAAGAPAEAIARVGDRLRLDAGATLARLADSSLLRDAAPVLPQSIDSAATPQVRSVATAAGNLLQRPRCWYYRNDQFNCLKKGGPTCFAVEGENRYHAIFGGGPCHIVHPSNLAPALIVCNATAHLVGGERDSIPVADLFHGPDRGVRTEHVLQRGEIVTHFTCDPAPRSGFYAVKEKQSFDWPLVMAAAALEVDGSVVRAARVCVGAVAPVPMRLAHVEAALAGVDLADDRALRAACADAARGASPMRDNAYKARLLPVAVRRAVLRAAGRAFEGLA